MYQAGGQPRSPRRRWRRFLLLGVFYGLLVLVGVPPLYVELQEPREAPTPVTVAPPGPGPFRVYVADWGYHTSITVEQPPGWRLGPAGEAAAPFVEYAWGDRRFYMESNYSPHALFATLFLPTSSVTYLDGRDRAPDESGARAVYLRAASGPELARLVAGLEGAIRRQSDGSREPPYPPVPGYGGRFYPGRGSYLWWTDCNRWTVARLAEAGLARSGRGVIFSGQVPGRLIGFRPAPPRPAV